MNLRLLREAELELHTAGLWYEEQSEGLGSRFQLDLARAFETIEANPDRFAKVPHLPAGIPTDLRRVLIRRFKFVVVYAMLPAEVVVVAIHHARREPNYWLKRIKGL